MRTELLFFLMLPVLSFGQVNGSEGLPRTLHHDLPDFLIPNWDKDPVHAKCVCYDENGNLLEIGTSDSLVMVSYCLEFKRADYNGDVRQFYRDPIGSDTIAIYNKKNSNLWEKKMGAMSELLVVTDVLSLSDTMYFEDHRPPYVLRVAYRDYFETRRK